MRILLVPAFLVVLACGGGPTGIEDDWELRESREGGDVTEYPREDLEHPYTWHTFYLLVDDEANGTLVSYYEYVNDSGGDCVEGFEEFEESTVALEPVEGKADTWQVNFLLLDLVVTCTLDGATLGCLSDGGDLELSFSRDSYAPDADDLHTHCD